MTNKTFSRSLRAALCAVVAALFLSSCADINVTAGMSEVAQANGEREAAEAIREAEAAEAAAAAQAQPETPAATPAQDASIALDEDAEVTPTSDAPADEASEDAAMGDDSDTDENTETDDDGADETDDDIDLPGQAATVTQGRWTVAQDDLGVRVRSTPAGEILGFILRGDVIATTGQGRNLNNVPWGEIEMADGTTGWMAMDLLESAPGADLSGTLGGNGSESDLDSRPEETEETEETAETDGDAGTEETEPVAAAASSTDNLAPLNVQPQAAFVSNRSATLAIWSEPGLDSTRLTTMDEGANVVIVSADGWRNGDVPFVRVAWDGIEGWVDGRFLDVNE